MTSKETMRQILLAEGLVPKNYLYTLQEGRIPNPQYNIPFYGGFFRDIDDAYEQATMRGPFNLGEVVVSAPAPPAKKPREIPLLPSPFEVKSKVPTPYSRNTFNEADKANTIFPELDANNWDLTRRKNPFPLAPAVYGSNVLGGLTTQIANMGQPQAGLGALGGALSGAAYGSFLGPVGAAVGGVIGGLGGFAMSGLKAEQYDADRVWRERENIKMNTISGTDIGEYQQGRMPEENPLEPAQTAKGEMLSFPSGNIYKVKSKKQHKQMEDDEVTDLLPPEAFVATDDKRSKISKQEAENYVFGYEPLEYSEGVSASEVKQVTLADVFGKKKMTPAEILNKVKNKFPLTDREHDPYARKANQFNLAARMPFIQAAIEVNKKFLDNGLL
jgi:hypothetical protein